MPEGDSRDMSLEMVRLISEKDWEAADRLVENWDEEALDLLDSWAVEASSRVPSEFTAAELTSPVLGYHVLDVIMNSTATLRGANPKMTMRLILGLLMGAL